MRKKRRNTWRRAISLSVACAAVSLVVLACEVDDKALVEKTLDAREKAMTTQDLDTYMALVSKDYKYKSDSKQTIREYMQENLLFWDAVHIQTYNRLIYIDKPFARVSQDYQMSVTKNEKPQVFSGAEHFVLKKEGGLRPVWRFVEGLD